MTVYQFRLFDSNDEEYTLLGVVSADDTKAVSSWSEELAGTELAKDLEYNWTLKLAQRPEIERFATQPPTEILRYNLPYLSSAAEEFPDFDAATANAERLIQENQTGQDYQEARQ